MIGLPRTFRERLVAKLYSDVRAHLADARAHLRAGRFSFALDSLRWAERDRAAARRVRRNGSVLPEALSMPWRRAVGPSRVRRMGGYEDDP